MWVKLYLFFWCLLVIAYDFGLVFFIIIMVFISVITLIEMMSLEVKFISTLMRVMHK